MAMVDRGHPDPVGQSGRRPRVRRGQCGSPHTEGFRTGGSAPAAGRAACQPVAAKWRDPAGAPARLRRFARHARDLRLRAARFSRWQPRHPGHVRQRLRPHHAAGRTAATAGRGHRLADRSLCARRHVHRRQRCGASAARLSQSVRSRPRRSARRRAETGPRRNAVESATWCCSVSARAPMSAWSR